MEQYLHTLIPVDSNFCPEPVQVGAFFDWLIRRPNFLLITGRRFQQGLTVKRAAGQMRESKNPLTGETRRWYVAEIVKESAEIAALIDGFDSYTASASGEWDSGDLPIMLFTTNGQPYKENHLCNVRCELKPSPVSTSAWDCEAGPNIHNVPSFGTNPCNSDGDEGIFPNPWNGEAIKVPHAGCARFWIEFEFGRFIYPEVDKNFDFLNPSIAREAEQCFQTKFVQGCHFW